MIEDILSPREMQVASLIAEGYEYVEIGRMLGTRPQTIKNQSCTIYKKLGLRDPRRRPSILLTRMILREQLTE